MKDEQIKKTSSAHPSSAHRSSRILGVDPGLNRTGWGIITQTDNRLSFIACGVITAPAKAPLPERLHMLSEKLTEVVRVHAPAAAAVEETFVNMNGASTLKLGQARGAILLSLSLCGLNVFEYAANLVKKSVVGAGHADKAQVAMMVATLLPGCRTAQADASDALAVAIAHAHHAQMKKVLGDA